MMDISSEAYRQGYAHWLRTGRWVERHGEGDIERKFNPYHDPRNGQFTFAPGGPRSLARVIVSRARYDAARPSNVATRVGSSGGKDALAQPASTQSATFTDAVYRPGQSRAELVPASLPRSPRATGGSNIRAFQDPMTLQQAIPGLQGQPGGAIVALADTLFDITGPAQELTTQLARERSNQLINQIKALDPDYQFGDFGFPETKLGQINQLNRLRFDQAATFLLIKNELRPMQLETLRFVQAATDRAYAQGIKSLRAGKLPIRLSEQEALGNFIDRRVRIELRERYAQYGIDAAGKGPVRVNRRENDSSGSELSFRRPDMRVGTVAYDVTLTQKTLKAQQIRGFFNADFKPTHVVIIRPHQIGSESSYIISRPETK